MYYFMELNVRVEIFSNTKSGYKPTYNYYKNGNLFKRPQDT